MYHFQCKLNFAEIEMVEPQHWLELVDLVQEAVVETYTSQSTYIEPTETSRIWTVRSDQLSYAPQILRIYFISGRVILLQGFSLVNAQAFNSLQMG